MKKIFLSLLVLFSLVGCGMDTPSKSVEQYLSGYNNLIEDILTDIETTVLSENINEDNKNLYRDILKRQYKDLKYEIKDEEIDGDTAVVTVQVEVMNYKSAIDKYDKGDYELAKYHDLVLNELEKTREMVTYTLEITLTKNNDDWVVDDLSIENRDKLLGIY
jgi:primase-polymerase (primpol)-like protein